MVPRKSPIKTITDLAGRKLAVAGGPLDKSWLLLQALALRSGIDLRRQASVVYGAPPLLSQKALQGEHDATLTFWNFCADLESTRFTRAIEIGEVMRQLGAKGPVAIVGYTFDGGWSARNQSAVDRFFAAVRQAKTILAASADEWPRLARWHQRSNALALSPALQRGIGVVNWPMDPRYACAVSSRRDQRRQTRRDGAQARRRCAVETGGDCEDSLAGADRGAVCRSQFAGRAVPDRAVAS
jgi:hypothetical protein